MELQTYIKDLKISPKKLRFLLPTIKKLLPVQAMEYLNYSPKRTARVFYQAIKSAVTNAESTLKIDAKLLKFKVLTVEEGQRLKRFRPGARGTAKPYKRRMAHIKIVLTADVKKKSKIKKVEKTVKSK